jgi:hypothetical protein
VLNLVTLVQQLKQSEGFIVDYVKVDVHKLNERCLKCDEKIQSDLDEIDRLFYAKLKFLIKERNKLPFWKRFLCGVPTKFPQPDKVDDVCRQVFGFSWSFRKLKLLDMLDELHKLDCLIMNALNDGEDYIYLSSKSSKLLCDIEAFSVSRIVKMTT